ncbi:hypothetical protein P4S72_27195 [Vibrio sp. PP-XX7]
MATTSFDKNFTVTDSEVIEKFKQDASHPRKVSVKKEIMSLISQKELSY